MSYIAYIACIYRPTGHNTWTKLTENTRAAVAAYLDEHPDPTITHVIVGRTVDSFVVAVKAYEQTIYTVRQEQRVVTTVERV